MTTTSRWQRKWERDHLTDGWSPIPTQIVSNEEYVPMPPTREQRRVADRLREMSRLHAAALGVTRRQFLASPCGMAAAFLAMNAVFGRFFDVSPGRGVGGHGGHGAPAAGPVRLRRPDPSRGGA